jgi:predicted PurR-regulated permease PerM
MVQIAVVRALSVGSLLGLCGVPWPLAIAVAIISFWLFFIPTLGSIVASILPLPMIVLLPDLTERQRVAGSIIPNLVSFLVGDLIGPVVYRKGLDLNEVTVLLALVFWYSVWGAAGAVLGVPLTCALKIVLEEMPHEGAHALAAVMAPVQNGAVTNGPNATGAVRVPMTITFIAWLKRTCGRLITPSGATQRRQRVDEEALLPESSSSDNE